MRTLSLLLFASMVVAGCAQPAPGGVIEAVAPIEATTGGLPTGRATLSVEGTILLATADAAAQPQRCAPADGVVGHTLREVTPGRPFALLATDANAPAQDIDIIFFRAVPGCIGPPPVATPVHTNAHGDEVGIVPPGARAAIVWLYEGASASFGYSEFPPLEPATLAIDVVDTMTFRLARPEAAVSTYNDLYEPHVVVSGTGAIYVTGHTAAADTHRSPVYVSRDDGATWQRTPDPEPLPRSTSGLPIVGGRLGQGNEGGIAADDEGRAWLYDAAWFAGTAPVYSWCDDGARACGFEPVAFDYAQLATSSCGDRPTPRLLDKPWARFGNGKLLLSNIGLPIGFVDEFRAASMAALYDPDTGSREWNTCIGVGGMPGIPAIRDSDGHIAIPQVLRTPEGEGWMTVHHGTDVGALATSPPIVRAHRSWQTCNTFNGYSTFDADGTFYLLSGTSATQLALSATSDFATFATETFDTPGFVRYIWIEGNPRGPGALMTWSVAEDCEIFTPVTFYAAHVRRTDAGLVVTDASTVASNVSGTCGHYMGNDVGPDGRAYLVVHASPGGCLGPYPQFLPTFHAPWRLYVQAGGPALPISGTSP